MITEEFIWRKDHYGYHITEKKNLESIKKNGLLPMCGDRCKSVGDTNIGICFCDTIFTAYDWGKTLYENTKTKDLLILRFNLINRVWHINSTKSGDFYLDDLVEPENIEIVRYNQEFRMETHRPLINNNNNYVKRKRLSKNR